MQRNCAHIPGHCAVMFTFGEYTDNSWHLLPLPNQFLFKFLYFDTSFIQEKLKLKKMSNITSFIGGNCKKKKKSCLPDVNKNLNSEIICLCTAVETLSKDIIYLNGYLLFKLNS